MASKRVKASLENHDVDGLIKGLANPKSIVRNEAATALGELTDLTAIEPLVRSLNDPDPDVRNSAACSLQAYGVENLGALLMGIVKNSRYTITVNKEPVRPIDINVIVRPASGGVPSNLVTCQLGPETIGTLIRHMGSIDPLLREKSIELVKLFGSFSVDPLIQALDDPDNARKVAIITALGDIGDMRALAPVKLALTDGDPAVRDVAEIARKKLEFTDTKATIPETHVDISNIAASRAAFFSRHIDEPAADPSYLKDLEKLGDLRSRGVLTEEEFQREKKEVLFKANKVEKIQCQYCGSSIDAYNEKCPVCGAPVKESGTSTEADES